MEVTHVKQGCCILRAVHNAINMQGAVNMKIASLYSASSLGLRACSAGDPAAGIIIVISVVTIDDNTYYLLLFIHVIYYSLLSIIKCYYYYHYY